MDTMQFNPFSVSTASASLHADAKNVQGHMIHITAEFRQAAAVEKNLLLLQQVSENKRLCRIERKH